MSTLTEVQTIFTRTLTQLDEYLTFGEDWDSYAAKPFRPEVIAAAKAIALQVCSAAIQANVSDFELHPGPCGDGSVDIEISCNAKHMYVTVIPDMQTIELYADDGPQDFMVVREIIIKAGDLDLREYFLWMFT